MFETFRARVADAIAGKPWGDGVPGNWITGDRIVDVVLLPLVWAVAFVTLRRILVTYLFEVGSHATGLQGHGAMGWQLASNQPHVAAVVLLLGGTAPALLCRQKYMPQEVALKQAPSLEHYNCRCYVHPWSLQPSHTRPHCMFDMHMHSECMAITCC